MAGLPMHVLALASAMPLAQIGVHYIGTALKQLWVGCRRRRRNESD